MPGVDVVYVDVGEVAVVAEFGRRQGVGAMAQHQAHAVAGQRLPVVAVVPLAAEAQDIGEVRDRTGQVRDGQDEGVGVEARHRRPQARTPKRWAARALAFWASVSRSRGGAWVSSECSRRW